MGSIADNHVEWAVVNRLKAMLDHPPPTKFNVTQSFALFTAILLWTKQRAWASEAAGSTPADHAARAVRSALQREHISEAPWRLSKFVPKAVVVADHANPAQPKAKINVDFEGMSVEQFVEWLRNALAHGDGRSIRPIHKPSRIATKTLLAGFEITFPAAKGSKQKLTLSLYHADMKRIGRLLADGFCRALSGNSAYSESGSGPDVISEAA